MNGTSLVPQQAAHLAHPVKANSSLGHILSPFYVLLQQGGQRFAQQFALTCNPSVQAFQAQQQEPRLVPAGSANPSHSADSSEPAHTCESPAYASADADTGVVGSPADAACDDGDDEDDEDFFDPFLFISKLPPLDRCTSADRAVLLPPKTRTCKPRTLVLDLDETLVHSTLDSYGAADFCFSVHFNNLEHTVHVRQRPYMAMFLERVAALYEVVVFTASQKVYAEKLLNILDPQRKLIRHRIYRDSCVLVEGNYLKDLSVLGRDLSQTAIIDNSPQAFGFQLDNGIPIESWYDDDHDRELLHLLPFLESLADADDVRPLIKSKFRMHERVAGAAGWVAAGINTTVAVAVETSHTHQQQLVQTTHSQLLVVGQPVQQPA